MRCLALLLAASFVIAAAPGGKGGIAILDASQTGAMLRQCSRSAPPAGEAGWKPAARDIAQLEAALPAVLAKVRAAHPGELDGAPAGWIRQYVGIVRGGRKFIYGNFTPDQGYAEERRWRREPVLICDGGVGFFGAEYDVGIGVFSHLAFNGSA